MMITIPVTRASLPAPVRAMITPMNTNGIVFEIRWAKLTCRNGAVRMPHRRPKLRA